MTDHELRQAIMEAGSALRAAGALQAPTDSEPEEPEPSGYCCADDWVPYCDTCGDEGCPDCDGGTKPNHQCARWQAKFTANEAMNAYDARLGW